jgi:SAM-dependent methyltransferase
MIFVLSAIAPEKHAEVMLKVGEAMKPGSFLFFRDYGRYDFGQLNLSSKGNRKLRDNFYRKNDGVCVYYFEEEELEGLCAKAGLKKIKINLHCKLLQNRKTGLKMYRVWIQGRFYKPSLEAYFEEKLSKQLEKEAIEEETEKK